jgi:hypothetical protein
MSGIVSPSSQVGWFYCLGRKCGFGPKFREVKITFFTENPAYIEEDSSEFQM